MVNLQTYLKSDLLDKSSPLPFINQLFVHNFSSMTPYGPERSYKSFMSWVKKSPQLIGFLNVIATDILSDEITFEPVDGNRGRNRVKKAENFWSANKGRDLAEQTLYDLLTLGIGYNWVGKVSDSSLKEFANKIVEQVCEGKEFEIKAEDIVSAVKDSQDMSVAKKLRHIAASTVSIESNKYEPVGYIQRVGGQMKHFLPEEIIEFRLIPLDGKLYPFPPMEALLSEIYLLWLINQNNVSFFENGGHPDKVFILPKELAGSKNHEYLINTLKKYKKIQNKHGNLVFTGDLQIENMMEVASQMENKDLALYLVGVLAMFYGIPAGRIPFLIGKAANNGDSGGLADSGYWRKISVWQAKLEEAYNRELWIPYFGVKMKFSRGYLQDEVREVNVEKIKNDIVEQRLRNGLFTAEAAGDYLKIDPEIVRKAQLEQKSRQEGMINSSQYNQVGNKNDVLFEPDKKLKNQTKQITQLNNQTNNGGKNINP